MPRAPVALLVGLVVAAPASAAPPRGKRTVRPRPTHVLVVDAKLDVGAEAPAELGAGTAVASPAKGGVSPSGKTKVTVVAPVELTGTIAGDALGQRVTREIEAHTLDGKAIAGKLRAGALVRVRDQKAPKGKVVVETVGGVSARVVVDATAVGVDPADLVLADPAGQVVVDVVEDADLYAESKLTGGPRATLAKGTEVVLVEQVGEAAHVTVYGPYELDGWTFAAKLGDRGSVGAPEAPERTKVVPTHEVFVDAPIFAGSDGKKRIGQLRGGTLVAITQKPQGGKARVRTLGGVRIEGWIDLTSLDELSSSAWAEP